MMKLFHKKKMPQGNSTSWHEFTFYHLRKVAQPQKLATGPPCCGHVNDNPSIVSYFNRFSWELRPSQTDPCNWHLNNDSSKNTDTHAQNVPYSNCMSPLEQFFWKDIKNDVHPSLIPPQTKTKHLQTKKNISKKCSFHSNKPFPDFLCWDSSVFGPLFSLTTAFGGAGGARNLSEDAVAKGFGISISKSPPHRNYLQVNSFTHPHYSGPVVFLGRWKKMCKLLTIL